MTSLTVQRQITVPRAIEDCFRYLVDFSTCEQWDPGVLRATKLTPGKVAEGTRFDIKLNAPVRPISMTYHLDEMQFPERIHLSGTGNGFSVQDRIGLKANGKHSTTITYEAAMQFHWVPVVARRLAVILAERIGDKAMQGLTDSLIDKVVLPDSITPALGEKLILPAAANFTRRGYAHMPHAGLTHRMDGKKVVITGPTSGLGLAAASELARLGAKLVLVGRDPAKMSRTVADINSFAGFTEIDVFEADLSLIGNCKRICADIVRQHPSIDVLINNAGALPVTRQETSEGHELSLAINMLTPSVMMHELLPALSASNGRVINVVSGGLYLQPLNMADIQFSKRRYDGAAAYARAKRATLTVTEMLAGSLCARKVAFHAMHPGWAKTPGVEKSLPGFNRVMSPWLRDARMGADTAVWLAIHPDLGPRDYPGHFWFDRELRPSDVLPSTRVSDDQKEELAAWLLDVCSLQSIDFKLLAA